MSVELRVMLIAASLISLAYVIRKIRKSKMRIDDAVFWIIFSAVLIVLSIFPVIVYKLSELVGTKSPANLIYLIIIAIMLIKIFTMSIRMSALETKLIELTQKVALDEYDKSDKGL